MSIYQLEKIVTIVILAIYAGAFNIKPPIENTSLDILGGSFVKIIVNIIHYLLLLFLIFRNWKRCIYISSKNIILIFLIGFMVFSIFWSETPQNTLFSSRWLLITFLFGAYLSWKYSIKEQMWLLAWVMGIVALESTILCLFFPLYGIHGGTWSGQWCGIYRHKNALGAMMALSAGVFLNLALDNYKYWWILWSGFALSAILLIFAKSTTSLAILMAFLSLIFIYKLIKQNQSHVLKVIFINIALMLITGTSIWLLDNAYTLVGTQGKDLMTFSGRTPMWSELMLKIADRPFLGYGYSGFWSSAEALNIKAKFDWAGDAHNGFITVLLELGIFGAIIYIITLLQFLLKALKRVIIRSQTWVDLWPMQFLVYFVIINLSESLLINPNLDFLIYVSILLSMIIESQKIRKNRNLRLTLASQNK